MVALIEWQMDVEEWRGSVESRIEGLEEVTSIIFEHIGPQTLTLEHQRMVQHYTKQLHEATGKPYGTIYDNLKTAFATPRYQDIPESEWEKVVNWFRVQLERKRK
jgi:porphobilinogen deaminase